MTAKAFEDAMHRAEVVDITDADLASLSESAADWPTPANYLPTLKQQISDILLARGHPDPSAKVIHRGQAWRVQVAGEQPQPGEAIGPGWGYTRRNAEPLTVEREAADLYVKILSAEAVVESGDVAQVFAHAMILGSAVNRFNARRLHLENVTRGAKVKRGLKRAAATTNALHGDLRHERFTRMAELTKTMSVDKAAAQCQHEGLGNWDTIKRQWNRDRKKRDT